jgi:hypothetical protein
MPPFIFVARARQSCSGRGAEDAQLAAVPNAASKEFSGLAGAVVELSINQGVVLIRKEGATK